MRKRTTRSAVQKFQDGVSNPLLRIGTATRNTFQATTYRPEFVSMNRQVLEFAYQSSWLAEVAVDIPAEDMTREGIEVRTENPEVIDAINAVFDDYGVFDSLCDAIKWARLYGGSIAVIMIDGDDVETPLDYVKPGSFRGLMVFDRWELDTTESKVIADLGKDFGKPEYYRVIGRNSIADFGTKKIHHSRVIRFEGRQMPSYLRQSYQGWGASILESLWDRVKGFDLATEGATQLLSKAYLRYYKVKNLRQILTNDLANAGFQKQMDCIREFQSAEGLTVGDAEDDFQTLTYTFTGIPEIILQIGQQISGALGIPLVRLFGQSPVGLSATGESDIRNYYDQIKKLQKRILRTGLKKILDIVYQSVTGERAPNDLSFEFNSLWQMSPLDSSSVAKTKYDVIASAFESGIIDLPTALTELKALSNSVGVFSSISSEDIDKAQNEIDNDPPAEAPLEEYGNS